MPENIVIRDDNGVPIGVSPIAIASVVKDVPIPHRAIRSMTPFNIYFDGAPGTTFTWPAGESLSVNKDMRITTTVQCLVY